MKSLIVVLILAFNGWLSKSASANDLIYKSGFEATALVSGTLSGMGSGSIDLQLQSASNQESLVLNENGSFTFATGIAIGNPWEVTVQILPAQHNCTLSQASGNMGAGGANTLTLTCQSGEWKWDQMDWDQGGWQ